VRSTLVLVVLATAVPAPSRVDPARPSAELRASLSRAEEAIRAAACDVERRFGEGDPDANAARCDALDETPGVVVGRTSARLRNPRNAPPAWARAYVEQTEGRRFAAVPAVAFDLGDRVGLLRPIEVRARCLACHAARGALSPRVRAWLDRAYPEDRAVGYTRGELRGFWWAEARKR
jgi:hypothetical protein